MKPSSTKARVLAVVLLACALPALISVVAYLLFGSARHVQERLHESLEISGSWIALAVAMLVWLRSQREQGSSHLMWVAAALAGMGLVDGAHAVAPSGVAWSWLRHGATLLGGSLFALVWIPLPARFVRQGRFFMLLVMLLAITASVAIWNSAGLLPVPWGPAGYSFSTKVANALGGLGFLVSALFFVRRYRCHPANEDLVLASHTFLFATASLLFGLSHVWAADWWVWHGFRLLAYGIVLIAAYELVISLYQEIAGHSQELERYVQSRTAELRRLASIVESSTDGIFSKSLDGVITTWNAGAERLYGYAAAEAVGQPLTLIVPAELHEEVRGLLGRVLQGESVRHHETVRVRKDGGRVDVSITLSAVKDEHGKIIGASAIARDITEQKWAEQERRRAEQDLEEFFAVSPDMLCIAGFDGHFKRLNPAWARVLGWSVEHLLETPYAKFVHPDDLNTTLEAAQRQQAGASLSSFENRYLAQDGSYRWMQWNSRPIPERQLVFAAARDVTAEKMANEELRRGRDQMEQRVRERTAELTAVNQDLETSNKELEEFTYSVAHDLRAPLRQIDGFSKILLEDLEGKLDPTARRYLDLVREGTRKMDRLVNDILELARVGRRELQRQPVGLNSLVELVLADLRPETAGRPIDWRIGSLPVVAGDPVLLRLVLANLLSNAVKFTRPRSPAVIEVGMMAHGGEDIIFVRDNGVGFDMKYAPKLFGVFQRLHRPQDFEGNGVGLVMVQRIIRRHGGRTWVEAAKNRGATFYFTLAATTRAGWKPCRLETSLDAGFAGIETA